MNFNLDSWIGQVTTGHGAMILGPTLLAAANGTITWQTAVPLLAAGAVGFLWPENMPLQPAAKAVATDVEALISAYRIGLSHGATSDASDAAAAAVASVPHGGAALSAIALLAATGLTLGACANQTPAQQVATETTIASGLLCLADASGKVVSTASTSDSNTLKAINAAIAAGNVLLTDTACQGALTHGVVALQSPATSKP